MAVDIQSEEARIIRQLIPLSTLPSKQFARLCANMEISSAEPGQFLFKRGEENGDLYFLLEGSINLQTESFKIETISAGSDSSRFAIAHQIPRKVDAVASSRIQFLRLNTDMMKSVQNQSNDENESTMMDEDLEDSNDWMTTLLKSPIFRSLPPANLQKILMSLQEIRFSPGEVIIHQGDIGDFYYIIKRGRALVSRKPAPNAKEIKLAQLTDLDTFGEDALISGEPRNVTITAITEMVLLRLGKEQFISLIKQPTLKYIKFEELHELLKTGAELIDVRGPDEFERNHLPHSTNVPFFSLRMYLKTLNRHHTIVLVCKDGRISESAAFVLQRHKFNAFILNGGIASLSPDQLNVEPIDLAVNHNNSVDLDFSEPLIEQEASIQNENATEPNFDSTATNLRPILQQMTVKYKALENEKKALEIRYLALARQFESVQAELAKLKES